jgi:hypothetical protein
MINVGIIAAALAVVIILLYGYFLRKLQHMSNRLQIMEKEFEIIRERSRSNLMVYRKVVDGLDEIIGHMKVSVEEEERKVALIKLNEQATTEHIEKTKRQQKSEERYES